MARRIAIIQGHPDPTRHHLLHALGDAYAEGAIRAGREVRRAEVAKLEFPLLRTQEDFESGTVPPALASPQDDMRWAEHWVFVFPLWHETMPALLKGFLEHIFRPGFAMDYAKNAAGDRPAFRNDCSLAARPALSSPWGCRSWSIGSISALTGYAASSAA